MFTVLSFDFNDFALEVLVPIFICVVLPCTIVWLCVSARRNESDRKAEIALKSIEAGQPLDPNIFYREKPAGGIKEQIFGNLRRGLVFLAIGLAILIPGLTGLSNWNASFFICAGAVLTLVGVAFIVVYFIGRKHFAKEIEAEENKVGTAE